MNGARPAVAAVAGVDGVAGLPAVAGVAGGRPPATLRGPVRTSRLLLAAVVGAQVAYPRLPAARRVAATRAIVGLVLGASVTDAAEERGAARAAALTGTAAAIGFGAELAGVARGLPFGRYAYSGQLGPRVRGVPLLAAACWPMMARPSWAVAGRITARRAPRAALAAGALAAWDVYLDPRMVRDGYWTWERRGAYEDVPLSNFAGWVATAAAVFAVWAVLDGDDAAAGDDGALALYAWTWIGEGVANVLFWERPRVALAGGVAMGAFALPALRARLAAGPRGR